jgi:hypothetical protein
MWKVILLLGLTCGCALSPAERWTQATGLTPQVEVVYQDTVMCHGAKMEGCSKPGLIRLKTDSDDGVELHERGHQLTSLHLQTGQSGVMVAERSNASWRECITSDDLDLVCSFADCTRRIPECK